MNPDNSDPQGSRPDNRDSAGAGGDKDNNTHTTHTINLPYVPRNASPRQSPNIDPIPRITMPGSSSSEQQQQPATTPTPTPKELAEGLQGKVVDDVGNIVDDEGKAIGRVEGDLPSMVGQKVDDEGLVFDSEGQEVGYVVDNYSRQKLFDLGGGMKADAQGNIYNQDGNVIGKLNGQPDFSKNTFESEARPKPCYSAPNPAATPRPDEVYLDVKSTHDGIQIILKIPTIFNRDR